MRRAAWWLLCGARRLQRTSRHDEKHSAQVHGAGDTLSDAQRKRLENAKGALRRLFDRPDTGKAVAAARPKRAKADQPAKSDKAEKSATPAKPAKPGTRKAKASA